MDSQVINFINPIVEILGKDKYKFKSFINIFFYRKEGYNWQTRKSRHWIWHQKKSLIINKINLNWKNLTIF